MIRCLCWPWALLFRSVLLVVDELDLLNPPFLPVALLNTNWSGVLFFTEELSSLSSCLSHQLFTSVYLFVHLFSPADTFEKTLKSEGDNSACVFLGCFYFNCLKQLKSWLNVQYNSLRDTTFCVCFYLCSPPAVINSKILTVTVRPEPQPSEPMVVVELSPLLNVSLKKTNCFLLLFFSAIQHIYPVQLGGYY